MKGDSQAAPQAPQLLADTAALSQTPAQHSQPAGQFASLLQPSSHVPSAQRCGCSSGNSKCGTLQANANANPKTATVSHRHNSRLRRPNIYGR
jgi:hypothetical protein